MLGLRTSSYVGKLLDSQEVVGKSLGFSEEAQVAVKCRYMWFKGQVLQEHINLCGKIVSNQMFTSLFVSFPVEPKTI